MGLQRLKKEIHGFKTLSCFSFKLVFITQISEPQKPKRINKRVKREQICPEDA